MVRPNKDRSGNAGDEQLERTFEELRSGLDQIDRLYPVDTPDLDWFWQMTLAEKRRLRRKLIRDLTTFWLMATIFLSVYLIAVHHLPTVYIVVAQLVIAVLPTVILIKKGRWTADEPYGQ